MTINDLKSILHHDARVPFSLVGVDSLLGERLGYVKPKMDENVQVREIFVNTEQRKKDALSQMKKDMVLFESCKNIFKQPEMVHIDKLVGAPAEWIMFPPHTKSESALLTQSIYEYNVICPLLVKRNNDGSFMVISGYERAIVAGELFSLTGESRFEHVPCMILENHQVDDLIIRNLMIDLNVTRTISNFTLTKIIIQKKSILEKLKTRRNEINVTRSIATTFKMSESSVNNYLMLENAIDDVMALLEIGQINLSSARKLSIHPKDVQQAVLTYFGVENMRPYLFRYIPTDYIMKLSEVDQICKNIKYMKHPIYAKVIVNCLTEDVDKVYALITEIGKTQNYQKFKTRISGDVFPLTIGYKELNTAHEDIPDFAKDFLRRKPGKPLKAININKSVKVISEDFRLSPNQEE